MTQILLSILIAVPFSYEEYQNLLVNASQVEMHIDEYMALYLKNALEATKVEIKSEFSNEDSNIVSHQK